MTDRTITLLIRDEGWGRQMFGDRSGAVHYVGLYAMVDGQPERLLIQMLPSGMSVDPSPTTDKTTTDNALE